MAPQPGPAGECVASSLNATVSKTSSCYVSPTSATCALLNLNYGSILCLKGDCSLTSSSLTLTTPSVSVSGTVCNNVLTGVTISFTIGSSNTAYVLSNPTITPVYSSVTLGDSSIVTLIVSVSSPSANSGNPGYQLGKAITISPSLSAIANPTTGNCYSSATGSITAYFGQTSTYQCLSATPCSNSYYVDSLMTSTIKIQKYASQSTETITVVGTGAGLNGCNNEGYTLQILYSYDGW